MGVRLRILWFNIYLILFALNTAAFASDLASLDQLKSYIKENQREEFKSDFLGSEDPLYPSSQLNKSEDGQFLLANKELKNLNLPVKKLSSIFRPQAELVLANSAGRNPASYNGINSMDYQREVYNASSSIANYGVGSSFGAGQAMANDKQQKNNNKQKQQNKPANSASVSGNIMPKAAESNSDSSIEAAQNGNANSNEAQEQNKAPIASADNYSVAQNKVLTIMNIDELLLNDQDADGDDLSIIQIDSSSVLGGSITLNANGSLDYTPPVDVVDVDSFKYYITDGKVSTSGVVEVNIYNADNFPKMEEVQSALAINSDIISSSSSLTAVNDDLYLAFIHHSDSDNFVVDVQGLGLVWQKLVSQCANKTRSSMEVWYAQGAPVSDGIVSAQLSITSDSAQMLVARYSNVDSNNPVGILAQANPLGIDALAVCNNSAAVASKVINIPVNTDENNSLIVSGIGYYLSNSFIADAEPAIAELESGSNPNSSGLIIQTQEAPTLDNYIISGNLQSATQWNSIVVQIKPHP